MKRREFIALVGGAAAAAWPLAARAQQPGDAGDRLSQRWFFDTVGAPRGSVPERLERSRWAEGQYDRLPALAADLVVRQVTVIVAASLQPWPPRRPPRQSRSLSLSMVFRSKLGSSQASVGRAGR